MSELLQPLVEALRRHVMNGEKVHGDDTPVPVLALGLGKTKLGRLWIYVTEFDARQSNTLCQCDIVCRTW